MKKKKVVKKSVERRPCLMCKARHTKIQNLETEVTMALRAKTELQMAHADKLSAINKRMDAIATAHLNNSALLTTKECLVANQAAQLQVLREEGVCKLLLRALLKVGSNLKGLLGLMKP